MPDTPTAREPRPLSAEELCEWIANLSQFYAMHEAVPLRRTDLAEVLATLAQLRRDVDALTAPATIREYRTVVPLAPELDSPPFTPAALDALAARGYERVSRAPAPATPPTALAGERPLPFARNGDIERFIAVSHGGTIITLRDDAEAVGEGIVYFDGGWLAFGACGGYGDNIDAAFAAEEALRPEWRDAVRPAGANGGGDGK